MAPASSLSRSTAAIRSGRLPATYPRTRSLWPDKPLVALATTISPLFYPKGNDTLALIAYLSTFAVGFVVRPFGALFFGRIGDLVRQSIDLGTGAVQNPSQNTGFSDPDFTQDEGGRIYNTGIDLANQAVIALELAESGRPTWLSGRDTGSIPRRLLGRDVYDWLWWTVMRPSVDSWVGRRLMGQLFAGDPLVGFSRRALMIPMLTSVSRTVGVSNGHPRLEDGRVLEDVRTVVWCTGFRPDFRWIQLPVFGPEGYPNHRRGIVAAAPGLGFVGLRYQYRIGSSLLGGVHEDAEYVVRQLASHDAPQRDVSS